jgi:parvulin-like peptidyl-prolyl isomerase
MALIEQTTLARLMIKNMAQADDQLSEAAAREYYDQYLAKYKLPDKVRASHILIKTEHRSDDEASLLAEKIRAEVIAGKDSFANLAQKYSEDGSAQQNSGDLGFFTRGTMAKPFEDSVFSMTKPGEISSVVKTQFGYHIIRLDQKQVDTTQAFSSVKNTIKDQLSAKRQQDIWKQYQRKTEAGKDQLVSKQQVKSWLWFAGMDNVVEPMPAWNQAATKLSMAKLLADKAKQAKFDQQHRVQLQINKAKRDAMVKLRRKALFDEIAKRDYSTAVKEQYIVNKDAYIAPLQMDISMIFLSNEKHSDEEILNLSESIHQQLANANDIFETLALKYSDAGGKQNNKGHIGLKKREAFGDQLGNAIFAETKPGIMSPISTPKGVFIIKINQIQAQHQLELDEVKDSIKATIVSDIVAKEYPQLVQSILNNPDNVVNHQAVERLLAELKATR